MGNRSINRPFVVLIVVVLICGCFVFEWNVIYRKEYDNVQKEAISVFDLSLSLDMNKRLKNANVFYSFTYDPTNKTDSVQVKDDAKYVNQETNDSIRHLSIENKQEMALQSLLLVVNVINVKSLDSLFQEELGKKGIFAESAVLYIDKEKNMEYTSTDLERSSLTNYSMGRIELGVQKEMLIEGFVKIHPFCVLQKHKKPFIILTSVWLFVMSVFLFGVVYYRKIFLRRKMREGITGIDENDDSSDLHPLSSNIIVLSPNLLFDIDRLVLVYSGMEILLTEQSTHILKLFLESPDYFLSQNDLVKLKWGNLADSSSRVTQAIKRLRESIAGIPIIRVENLRGKGYVLVIDKEEILDIDEGNL